MFNVSVDKFASDLVRVRAFQNHVFTHEPVKCSAVMYVDTPFRDENGEIMKAKPMLSDEELEFRRQESIRCSLSRTKNTILRLILSRNDWKFFATFTFSPDKVDRYDYEQCRKYIFKYLSDVKKSCPDVAYLIVPELHKDGAYHFHGIFTKELPTVYVGEFKKTGGATYHCVGYDGGFNTATLVRDTVKCARYICSYITKDMIAVSKYKKRYFASENLHKSDRLNFFLSEENLKLFLASCESKKAYGGLYNAKGNESIKYAEYWISPEILDDIILLASSYESDGCCYSFDG